MEIIIQNLTKEYGKVIAVRNLSVSIRPDHVTALVGPNGAGKSTLLRLMSGREAPTAGDVLYDGVSICDYPEKLMGVVGFMPDSLPESKVWTVEPYLDHFARAQGLKGKDRLDALAEIIAFLRIEPLLTRKLSELSKGLKQRVSLARVLLGRPKVLLLDEPAAGLDPRARMELQEDIAALSQKGIAIVVSSHILSELETMCDDAIIMECGELRHAGPIRQMAVPVVPLDEPADALECRISLEVPEATDALLATIGALPHCGGCNAVGTHGIAVAIKGGNAERDAFMAALFQAHLPILSYKSNAKSLEELFMDVTNNTIQ